MRNTRFLASAVALVLALAAVVAVSSAGAGGNNKQAAIKVALVTDIGGLNDHGFNQAANAGRILAQKQLKVQTRVFNTTSADQRLPNIQAAATQGYGLVIGTGFFMGDPINQVAPQYPKVKFAGIDVDKALLKSNPKNYRGLIFKEQEAGYLVGYLAGLVVKQQGGDQVVSAIGANTVPAIVRYFAGYKAGVLKANPGAKVLEDYANDPTFSDQAKCRETAQTQLTEHTQIIFAVAGGCGLGALDLAKSNNIWGIGVDSDQLYLGPEMLTSALKNVSTAVFDTIKDYKTNPAKFKTGFNKVYSVKNGGVGYGKVSAKLKNRTAIIAKVNAIEKLIASGKIVPPAQ